MKYIIQLWPLRLSSNLSLQSVSSLRELSIRHRRLIFIGKPLATLRYRAFHQSISRPFYYEGLHTTHDLFQFIHSVSGTPWSLTIPLIALLIRTTLSLPLAIIQRRASYQQVKLIPILLAWKHNFQKETLRESGDQGPKVCNKVFNAKMRRKRKELYKRHNCGRWKIFLGPIQIPIFLGVMDILRRMSNVEVKSFTVFFGVEKLVDGQRIIPLEPDLANEGMLWFPNLMLADPQLALPFILSGVILLNIFASGKPHFTLSKTQVRLRRGMGVAAICVGPLFLQIPSALLLYWISNSLFNWLQGWFVAWLIPIPDSIQPLKPKRPWRIAGFDQIETETKKITI